MAGRPEQAWAGGGSSGSRPRVQRSLRPRPPVGAQCLDAERVQAASRAGRAWIAGTMLARSARPVLPARAPRRGVAALVLGPVDVAARWPLPWPALHRLAGRGRGGRRRGRRGGGGGAGRRAARGQRVGAMVRAGAAGPPRARAALAALHGLRALAVADMPRLVARRAGGVVPRPRARHGARHGRQRRHGVLLPPGVSEVHFLHAAGGAEAIVV